MCSLLQYPLQSCSRGGGEGRWRTCATRDDEPRPAWTSLPITHSVCVCVYYCRTYYKLCAGGEGDSEGHVLSGTTSQGLCGLVCPSRTSEREGEGYCVKGGWRVCVLLLQDLLQSCARGGRRVEDMCYEMGPVRNPVLEHRVRLFSLVPLVWESNPRLQGGWCKTRPPVR